MRQSLSKIRFGRPLGHVAILQAVALASQALRVFKLAASGPNLGTKSCFISRTRLKNYPMRNVAALIVVTFFLGAPSGFVAIACR